MRISDKWPMTKQCQKRNDSGKPCGKFMELWWVESGSSVLPPDYQTDEGLVPVFFCPSCNGFNHPPDNVDPYAWLIYQDTIDWEAAKQELDPDEFAALVREYQEMEEAFLNRSYRILPQH